MAIVTLQTEVEKRKGIYYQLDTDASPIGEGGMGKVYEGACVDVNTGASRPVAIKFMYDDLPASAYERAKREAEIQLRNDNLIEMLGFIETKEVTLGEAKTHYHVVSELLTGVSLSDVFEGKTKDRYGEDVPFAVKMLQDYKNDPEHFAITIVTGVLSGLMALHDAGYIHRDIDPSNIMLTADGHIKLIDFGIAKQMNTLTTSDKSLTVAGKFIGKPEYASPELALGDIQHQNQTTDIYAMGILLYQCILGHTPFEGARHEVLDKQIKTKLPLEKIKNKALRGIIAVACEKRQELRYQSAAQMRVALETMGGTKPPMTPKKIAAIVGGVFVVVLVMLLVLYIVNKKQEEARHEAEIARIEQLQSEVQSDVSYRLSEAANLMQTGLARNTEDYEQRLMDAYNYYSSADSVMRANTEIQFADTTAHQRMSEILAALDSISIEMVNQSEELEQLGESEMASSYKVRIENINNFRNSHNNEK